MIFDKPALRRAVGFLSILGYFNASAFAATLDFTITTNRPVTITGTPRLAIDVGGVLVHGDRLFILSGYGMFGQMPGNMLLVYGRKIGQ